MEPKLVQHEGGTAVGVDVRTRNQEEMEPGKGRIPSLWERFFREGIASRLQDKVHPESRVGVYSEYESDHTGYFTLMAGMLTDPAAPVPAGMKKVAIPAGEYLVFRAEGEMPGALIQTWMAIWKYFGGTRDVKRKYLVDFEAYQAARIVDIYISVD